jgi:hypothetical protein
MTTVPGTVTTTIPNPTNVRIAHIVVTPPSSYSTGGIAIPLPAGFRKIRVATCSPRITTANALWYYDPGTKKLYAKCTAAGATGFTEASASGDLSAQIVDVIAYDWDEVDSVTVAAS